MEGMRAVRASPTTGCPAGRHENPSHKLHLQSVAALAASIDDFKRGESGSLVGEHSAELPREFGLTRK